MVFAIGLRHDATHFTPEHREVRIGAAGVGFAKGRCNAAEGLKKARVR